MTPKPWTRAGSPPPSAVLRGVRPSSGEIPIELGRELILGAATYARGLGFEPAAAFDDDAAAFLGEGDGPGRIEFGKDGQPFYLNGPYDNPAAVIRTLERSVGAGNFHVSVAAGPM
ncbi:MULTISPECIES: hypothetical protein [unclassified Rhodococcus (in: high G+C Gram-positive bacteria)]|uniref:hypothetical protein n=1 Tax=unclassified Rhodococcus (in: high G+C Gram-positive bacteria) TaxID=192944 RepID=UPI0002DECEDC|nr:hypothetical protein [Rhodococcus sp. DK17]